MNKIFLTSGVVLSMLSPAFATDPSGIPAQNGAAQSSDCVEDVLGVASGGVTLEPKWTSNISGAITLDDKRYTSSQDANGTAATTAGAPAPLYSKYADGLYSNAGATAAVTTLSQTPVQTGYTFAGYYTSKYENGTQVIDANGNVLPAASTQISSTGTTGTFYAYWTANQYNVTYNKGAGAGSNYTHTKGATYDSAYTIPSTGDAGTGVAGASTPQTGYTFIGWTTSPADRAVIRTPSATAINTGTVMNAWTGANPWRRTEDLSVYAAYLANQYTVSYLCSGGEPDTVPSGTTASGTVANQVVTFDSAYKLNDGAGCTLKGYTFNGWSCTNSLSGALSSGNPASGTWSITNDSTCTAQWTANSIALTWDNSTADSGGTGGAASCSYDSAITPLPTNPTKTGYTFDGWKIQTSSNSQSQSSAFDLTTITGTNLTDGMVDVNQAYINSDGSTSAESIYQNSPNEYGLTENGTWGATLADGLTKVRGISRCYNGGWANDDEAWVDGVIGNPVEHDQSGYACWCKVTGYQAANSSSWQDTTWGNSEPGWVYVGGDDYCHQACASTCANGYYKHQMFGHPYESDD